MNLTTAQLAAIDRHLRQDNWLLNDALIAELTDHYAVAVAEKIATGVVFETAMREIDASFGGKYGLSALERHYVQASNKSAWKKYRQIAVKYLLLPRLLVIGIVYLGLQKLINYYGLDGFLLLWIPFIGAKVLVSLPFTKWIPAQSRFDWRNRPFQRYFQRKYSGNQLITNIMSGIAVNIPTLVFVFYHPLTYKRPNEDGFLEAATIGLTIAFFALATVAELTYRQNPVLKRFIKPA